MTKKTAKTEAHATESTTAATATREHAMTTTTTHHATKTTKPTTTKTPSDETVNAGGIAPLPVVGAPAVPDGNPGSALIAPGIRMPKQFSAIASGIVKELRSSTTYVADFGKNAPSQSDLADRIALAVGWAKEDGAAKEWAAHAHGQATQSWQVTQPRLYELAPAFKYALERDPTVAERYPSTVSFFGLATAAAQRGVATREAKKKGQPTQKTRAKEAKAALRAQMIAAEAAAAAATPAVPVVAATPAPAASTPVVTNGATGH